MRFILLSIFFVFQANAAKDLSPIGKTEDCGIDLQILGKPGEANLVVDSKGERTTLIPEGSYTFDMSPPSTRIYSNYNKAGNQEKLPKFELIQPSRAVESVQAKIKIHTKQGKDYCDVQMI